jgi:ribosome-binding protein aMBF1 (putative translation factor)
MRKTGVLSADFPALLKAKREARHMSVQDLAMRVGVSGEKIESWESGRARPARERWVSLSNALGITVDELLYGAAPRRTATPASDLATQVGRLVAAFMVCDAADRQTLLRSAEFRARGRSTAH